MTITLTREEAQQVLDAFLGIGQRAYDAMDGDAFHECSIAVSRLRARLARQTPYEVGQRLYREGKGISFIPTAVPHDDDIAEALRGFEDARLSAPKPEPVAYGYWNERLGWYGLSLQPGGSYTAVDQRPLYTAPPQREPSSIPCEFPEPEPDWRGIWPEEPLGRLTERKSELIAERTPVVGYIHQQGTQVAISWNGAVGWIHVQTLRHMMATLR